MRALLLDDDPEDRLLAAETLTAAMPGSTILTAGTATEYLAHLDAGNIDVIVADKSVRGCEGLKAFHLARARHPQIPFVILSGVVAPPTHDPLGLAALGIEHVLTKDRLEELPQAVADALRRKPSGPDAAVLERLVAVVNALSLARDLDAIMAIVRRAARDLTGADGATFILRDGNKCFYADEDAIGPLWKGQRFPMEACISGWAMLNRQPAIVPDIRCDTRIPLSAYEPTFVHSVVMVPIRALDPVGAIGTYWAVPRRPEAQEVRVLQALADTTAVAMENVRVYTQLEARVRERTAALEAFTYAVSHDLRAPVRHLKGFAGLLQRSNTAALDDKGREHLARIDEAASRMDRMIDALLALSTATQAPLHVEEVDLAALAGQIAAECQADAPRKVEFVRPETAPAQGDRTLLGVVLQNLLGNAWKYSSKAAAPRVEFGVEETPAGPAYFVRDNGVGFDPAAAPRLFNVFQRLHTQEEFPGTGVGLATVQRIVQKHGGRVWATAAPGKGATFFFTLR